MKKSIISPKWKFNLARNGIWNVIFPLIWLLARLPTRSWQSLRSLHWKNGQLVAAECWIWLKMGLYSFCYFLYPFLRQSLRSLRSLQRELLPIGRQFSERNEFPSFSLNHFWLIISSRHYFSLSVILAILAILIIFSFFLLLLRSLCVERIPHVTLSLNRLWLTDTSWKIWLL